MTKSPRLILASCIALLCVLGVAPITIAEESIGVSIVTGEGEEKRGALSVLTDAECKLDIGTFKLGEVSELRFASPAEAPISPAVHFRNGEFLRRTVLIAADETKFKVKSEVLGELELENKFIDAIVFPAPKNGPADDAIQSLLAGTPPQEDVILTAKGDRIAGFFEKIAEEKIHFSAGGQTTVYPFDQVAAFRLAPLTPFKTEKAFRASIVLRDGSRIGGVIRGLDGKKLSFASLSGAAWTLNIGDVQSIIFSGGKLVFVSELKPTAVEQKPYVGGAPIIHPWRANRSATNDVLSVAGKSFEKGIGVHSFCKLTYALNGEYVRFLCDVGLDKAGGASAACAWKVVVDGKDAASGVASQGKIEPLKLELAGAKTLELICDFGPDDDDAGDHLDWANARLLKQ